MALTPLTSYPDRTTQTQAAFNAAWTSFFPWMATFSTEINIITDTINSKAADVAAASATVARWVSGASYTQGDVRWSPSNYQNYRRKTTSSAGVTDPSVDTTNWAPVVSLASLTLTGTTTLDVLVGTSTTDSSSATTGGAKFAGGVGVAKALYVGGVITALTGINVSGGTSASTQWSGATNGMQIRGITGSLNDFCLFNPAVSVELLKNPTGTSKLVSGGAFTAGTTLGTAGYTVSGLPAGVTGARAYVTDASGPTYGATVVGGGAVVTPVFYNGSAWKCL